MTVHIDKLIYNNRSIKATVDLLPITVLLGKPYLSINDTILKTVDKFPIVKSLNPSCTVLYKLIIHISDPLNLILINNFTK